MSASRERRERQAQRTTNAPNGKRIVKSRKSQKQDRVTRWVVGVFVGIIIFTLSALFLMGQGIPQRVLTAATVGGERIRVNEFEYHYQMAVRSFMEEYGEFVSFLGFNPGQPHSDQIAFEDVTWKDYFVGMAMDSLLDTVANAQDAANNGMTLGDWEFFMIEDYLDSLRSQAAASGMSMNRMLTEMFGRGTTEASLRATIERLILADMWKEQTYLSFEVTEQHVEARYWSNPESYDQISFHILQLAGDLPEDEDHDFTEEDFVAAFEEALQRANAMYRRVTAANFYTLALEYSDQIDREWLTEVPNGTLNSYLPVSNVAGHGELGGWLSDLNRRAGDKTVITDEAGHYVILFVSRTRFPQVGASVRHILFRFDDFSEEDAGERATELLREWRTTEATEENFGLMATVHSGCGSAADGGLFVDVLRGEMVPEFNDWLFAGSRRPGDTGVVRTQFGYHVMYFVGQSENPIWPRDRQTGRDRIRDELAMEWFQEYQMWLLEQFTITPSSMGLRFL